MLKIGISACFFHADPNRPIFTGKTLQGAMVNPDHEATVKRGGAIPGAVFSPWSKYAGNKDGQPDKPTLKDPAELAKQLEKLKTAFPDVYKTYSTGGFNAAGSAAAQAASCSFSKERPSSATSGSWVSV